MKRLTMICILGLGLLAYIGIFPDRVAAAPQIPQSCTLPATVTTTTELADCITAANANGAGLDTITLGADITLNAALPQVTSTIVVEGAGYFIDGANSRQIFNVGTAGNLTVNQTTLQNGSNANGGGIYNNGLLTVTNSTVSGNSATWGGGIYNNNGTLAVTNSIISANAGDYGSGVYNKAALTVTNSTFSGNSAINGGGILNSTNSVGPVTVINSTFSGNTATGRGGGIYNNVGFINTNTVTVINSTFSGNTATVEGGGIYNDDMLTVSNSTFSGNLSTNNGGGVKNYGTAHLAATIFVAGLNGGNCSNNGGTITNNGYNLSDDASCSFSGSGSANNATLALGDLADNGGPTLTHLPALGSDAIGAIPNGTTISNNGVNWTCDQSSTDQRGELRPINSGDDCTAGAVEVVPVCPSWTVTTATELSECIALANANESPNPTADTITLGADITLNAALPLITSAITLEGAGYAVDGADTYRIFYVVAGNFTINQATLRNGNASGDLGGGIYNEGGTLTVSNSTLSGNSAENGGGIYSFEGAVTVTNSTFSGNSANYGSGIYNFESVMTVTNSTFSGNSAGFGSIANVGALTLTSSTFSGNTGGGLFNGGVTAHLAGNIFAVGGSGANCTIGGTLIDNGYNLSDDASCGFSGVGSDINATLNLGDLADNGGPTLTHLPGAGSGTIGLIPNGTTISNNGTTWTCNQTATDQRGTARPITGGDDCTAGAVEVVPLCPSWTPTTADELSYCITTANNNGANLDTITLGADIDLTDLATSPLPNVTSTIVVEGAGHAIDGGDSVRLFYVGSTGNLTVNQATLQNGFAADGGGIYNNGGTLTVTDSTLTGNSASNNGGGIHNALDSTLTVANSRFAGNTQTYQGGGMYNNGRATVAESTFSGNAATFSGGGIMNNQAVLTVTHSTFSANTAGNSGGGLDNNGTATVSANTFSGNSATVFGGGIRNSAFKTLIATYNTFSGNSAANSGGGIYNFSGTLHLAGNIFAAGAQGDNCQANASGILNDNGYNLSDDATCTNSGTGSAANATLNLRPLADNGGSTQTHLPDYPNDAIGAIPNGVTLSNSGVTLACNSSATDQTGKTRPVIAGTACTSGAVEAIPNYANLTIIKDATPAIGTDFDFTVNSAPLEDYSGTTSGRPFWTRPNEGPTCTLSTVSTRYHVQAFVVDTSGGYDLFSEQNYNGYIHLYQDSFSPIDQCNNYLDGDDDGFTTNTSQISNHFLEAGRVYYLVTSGAGSGTSGNFTNSFSGAGTVYTLDDSFTLDDAVPDDGDGVNAGITFNVAPGTYAVTEAGLSGWGLTGATCTGAGGSFSLTDDTLSVEVGAGESVQCTFTNETLCPASWAVTSADELAGCITLANANESPGPTADTITLGANITLTTALPQITSAITLEGAGYAIDGNSRRIFYVNSGGGFTVNNATLQNGFATNGGGIYNNGMLTVTNSTLSGNLSEDSGGAIYNYTGTLTVTNSIFADNSAIAFGGGISNDNDGPLTVANSTFSGNSANYGGGISNWSDTATVTNSTFFGNRAEWLGGGGGGAIYNNFPGTLTVTNSTLSDNSVDDSGGGIYNNYGTLTLTNSTFADNSATNSGGGVYNRLGTAHLAGTIFANSASGNNCVNISGTLNDNGYNLSDDDSCGFDESGASGSADNAILNLGVLANNGGPTWTHLPGAGSNAIGVIPNGTTISNNGTSWSCNEADTFTDQRGVARPVTLATACTAGAVEVALPPVCLSWTVTTADELADCVTLANANESPSPTADTITLGASITLTTALPQITSEITLEGANQFIDGANSVQLFYVAGTGNLSVNQATLQNGTASSGGGINNDGTLAVNNSTFSGNSATDVGGGINNTGTLSIANSTLSGNSADDYGGGIDNSGTLTITNSTLSGNSAYYGGGIDGYSGTLTIINSTFSDNSATDGSSVYNSGATVHLAGSIFAAGLSGANCANFDTLVDNGYNLSDDVTCTNGGAGSATNATLPLGALADNGGPTQTHLPGGGSDAIGAIPNGTMLSNNGANWTCDQSSTDQRGELRPINSG
ncbi:MAG: hypothetical protein M9928_18215, partial [Anaerolineae bacterium]|nr:hypothetical protein [Anaerolineae bacterium]